MSPTATPPPERPSLSSGHRRQSSIKSLSFLSLSSSGSSPSPTPAYQASSPGRLTPSSGGIIHSPNLQVPPSFIRRASEGYASPSSTAGSSTITTLSSTATMQTENMSAIAATSPQSPPFRTRVKRSCSTSALTALSMSSAASPRARQLSGKAAIAEPALDCTNSDNGDLAITRSRSGSASALTDSTFTQPSSSFFTSLSSSSLSSSTVQMPQNGGVVIATPRRQSLTSMLMTSLYPAWNKEDTQEVLSSYSSSSVSSPTSSEASPTTPTSASSAFRLPSPLQRAPTHKHLWSNEANLENRDTTKETLPADRKVYTSISSPPPTKRSRSNTVNTCLKSSTALRSITEKGRPEGNIRPTGTTTTARRMTSNLSLRGVPSFSGGGGVKNDGLVSPKSPKSPLAKAFPQTYFEPSSSSSFDGPEDYSLTIKQSSSFGTLLLPSTLSNIPSCNASAVPSTPLTPSHTVYIDHIIVSYSPSSSTGQDCKKLLMRLERFKKRSSLDLSTLSSEQITSSSSPTLSATTTTQRSDAEKIKPEGMKRKVSSSTTTSTSTSKSSPTSASAPSSARISRCNSAGSTPTAHANGTLSPTSPGGTAGSNGNGQILRVIAKIKDHHEQNKIEAVYVDGFKLTIDATGLSHLDMLERLGLHAHVMAKRNAP